MVPASFYSPLWFSWPRTLPFIKLQVHSLYWFPRATIKPQKWLNTREIYSLVVKENWNLRQGCEQEWFLMKTSRENLFCAAPLVSGNTRNSSTPASASTFKMPFSLCLCVSQSSFSPLFIWIPVISFGAHPKSRMLSSQDSQLHLQRSYFQARLHSQFPRIRTWTYLWGNSIQFTMVPPFIAHIWCLLSTCLWAVRTCAETGHWDGKTQYHNSHWQGVKQRSRLSSSRSPGVFLLESLTRNSSKMWTLTAKDSE